jgi:hypothetical protein
VDDTQEPLIGNSQILDSQVISLDRREYISGNIDMNIEGESCTLSVMYDIDLTIYIYMYIYMYIYIYITKHHHHYHYHHHHHHPYHFLYEY